jgi:hypothetical protein
MNRFQDVQLSVIDCDSLCTLANRRESGNVREDGAWYTFW